MVNSGTQASPIFFAFICFTMPLMFSTWGQREGEEENAQQILIHSSLKVIHIPSAHIPLARTSHMANLTTREAGK